MFRWILILGIAVSCTMKDGKNGEVIDFSFVDIYGRSYKISDFRGKVVIMDFWATWCPPCRKEIPHFIEIQKEFQGKVQFIGFNVGEDASTVRRFVEEWGINYIVAHSRDELEKRFSITGLPTTLILDKQGRLRYRAVGYRPPEWFRAKIETLLREES